MSSKSKTKTYKNKNKFIALRGPKGSKSGQSKPKGSKRYIIYIKGRIYYPRLLGTLTYCAAVLSRSILWSRVGRRHMTRALKITGACSIILLLLLLLSDPRNLPSVILIVPFALVFIILWLATTIFLDYYAFAKAKRARTGLIVAAIPVLLLGLQSLGQLTIRDTLAICILFVITYFYLSRFTASTADR